MNQAEFIGLYQEMLSTLLLLSTPILGASLAVGVGVSIFQAVTQIQEATLTFVPKLLVSVALLMLLAPWMVDVMVLHTAAQFNSLSQLAMPEKDSEVGDASPLALQPAPQQQGQ